ncbi:sel1 repeat family protein [Photobacterium sp. ZSDE20]|uniref:Sel1 repeat family protein n=1 Tax=Photobacterium pectinilyticum TaxID=2906793 RepID=A0ABT1MYL3_9GAMM|nr:tetratricopeptide repeat protein [Photobacterium sp. ZSDE20]MCQ1057588.1 sel1 repeat family protein [Photobacterium sp. ZSDE20]MDD1822007.1 sel1 repeat family protein [Photobacterium sp. ZSDE20]
MPYLMVVTGLSAGLLAWILYRVFASQGKQQQLLLEKRQKEARYQQVLEKAKIAEREEKIFKAQTGHVSSQLSLAKEYELTNVREAINWYDKAAKLDNIIAQNALARLCRADIDDPEGEAKSRYWEQVVKAKCGESKELFELGLLLIRGQGTDIDVEAGLEMVQEAADKELIAAMLFLGDWYLSEFAQPHQPLEAFLWRFRAAKQGDINGFMKTAFCYQVGIGVSKDCHRAMYWLERAAERGDGEAQMLVAKMHNRTTMTDATIAYIWYSLAYVNGYKQAKEARDEVVQLLDIDTILGVQNVANKVYKMLKQDEDLAPHSVMYLLDKLYGREGYRPTEENLETLALGDLASEMSTLQPVDNIGSAEIVQNGYKGEEGWSETDMRAAKGGLTTHDLQASTATSFSAANSESQTSMSGYQQQPWQASWDSLLSGNDDNQGKS